MTEKRQTSKGYIIRILQHFATKLWNITNFVMLFQAVMKFLSRLYFLLDYYNNENTHYCFRDNETTLVLLQPRTNSMHEKEFHV
jgi:hypothetical protein